MAISNGTTVQIKVGVLDTDTGISIGGWSGVVVDVDNSLLYIKWNAPTLVQLPAKYIMDCLDGGYDYTGYHIELIDVEEIPGRSTEAENLVMRQALEEHYEAYELDGRIPPPFRGEGPRQNEKEGNQVESLLHILKEIKGNGTFVATGELEFTHPGLAVEGVGMVALPVLPIQAKALIGQARKAPFGKGSKTITDTSVRSAWEIDADQLHFENPEWEKSIQNVLKSVKKSLGLKKVKIAASLYKLLIYEEGDFFLPHKDSEKEQGMFGTLVVSLPSAHEGGELWVRFDGREECIDFSTSSKGFVVPYAAFYADCEHEVKPVKKGCRVGLVYNLVQSGEQEVVGLSAFSKQAGSMVDLLKEMAPSFPAYPRAVLLDHQYTPANFSMDKLKGHDKPRVEALSYAAEKAGYYFKLGLVTLYRMGDLEGADDYYYGSYSRYGSRDSEQGTMGEVYEEYTEVKHWAEGEMPGLGELGIHQESLIGGKELGEGKPIEQEEEGFTGNAGMTIEYWYHYGAVFLWSRAVHADLLMQLQKTARLEWLSYYTTHWNEEALAMCRMLLKSFSPGIVEAALSWKHEVLDYSPFGTVLYQLCDVDFMKREGVKLLGRYFYYIRKDSWMLLARQYGIDMLGPAFQEAAQKEDVYVLHHLLEVLRYLANSGMGSFVQSVLSDLPEGVEAARVYDLSKDKSPYVSYDAPSVDTVVYASIDELLQLAKGVMVDDNEWAEAMANAICIKMPRDYVNGVLVPLLLVAEPKKNPLGVILYDKCQADLVKRTTNEPIPPKDWVREVPYSKYNQAVWNKLAPFLKNPNQRVLDYKAVKAVRKDIERTVRYADVDLKMETIRKGSPHTLRLTKTQGAYQCAHKRWKEDVELLRQLEQL